MSRPPTHGMTGTPSHKSWCAMKARCYSPKNGSYKRYGAVGIAVCERWLHSFQNFYDDMGDRPDGMTLEREDGTKGYSPENCIWSTPKNQAVNRKSTKLLTLNGVTMCTKDWAIRLGMNPYALNWRLQHGWSLEDALTIQRRNYNVKV